MCLVRCYAPAKRCEGCPPNTGEMAGGIVNVSSGAAKYGSPGEYVDYAASKGAIDTFTVGLAKEVAEEGIRVNAFRPGHIYTELHAKGGEPQRVDRVKALVPMHRGGQPEEVAYDLVAVISRSILHHRYDCRCVRTPLESALVVTK